MDTSTPVDQYLLATPYSRDAVLTRPCPIPAAPGAYGWWIRRLPVATGCSSCQKRWVSPLGWWGFGRGRPWRELARGVSRDSCGEARVGIIALPTKVNK